MRLNWWYSLEQALFGVSWDEVDSGALRVNLTGAEQGEEIDRHPKRSNRCDEMGVYGTEVVL